MAGVGVGAEMLGTADAPTRRRIAAELALELIVSCVWAFPLDGFDVNCDGFVKNHTILYNEYNGNDSGRSY